MTLEFRQVQTGAWRASAGRVAIFVDDQEGAPHPAQAAFANRVAADLSAIEQQAAQYLDAFVDRTKAGGGAGEPWWFDEIELCGLAPGVCRLGFSLEGDTYGHWTVDLAERHNALWPVRFERRQS